VACVTSQAATDIESGFMDQDFAETLSRVANQLRIHSIAATTAAGSGHPSSCASAADLVAALFFGHMRYDPKNPLYGNNDRFILSKGHAAPLLYAAWAEAGLVPKAELLRLRELHSDLEGHPTPRLAFVDVATGSLGQGLSAGLGMALSARMDHLDFRTYVLLGDGECAEGSVWEAANLAGVNRANNLIAIVDVNRLGQSEATPFGHDMDAYRKRFEAFNWRTEVIDGHAMDEILEVLGAAGLGHQPLAILARTNKGHGIPAIEDKEGWHGKPLSKEEAERAIAELQPKAQSAEGISIPAPTPFAEPEIAVHANPAPIQYEKGKKVATREAYGNALVRLGEAYPKIVALDGDTKNSTYSEKFSKRFPSRFVECFIAEQNMVGLAVGLSARGKIPFVSTFAAFLTRAHDQIRMGAISFANLKLAGSHVGVSIGEDGASQMGLEDLAMFRSIPGCTVLYPADAIATEKLMEQALQQQGMFYLRLSRPKTDIIYGTEEAFPIGGAKILRQKPDDCVTVVAGGVTLYEALNAAELLAADGLSITVIDAYSVKPLAKDVIREAASRSNQAILTVEDHYAEGGLGEAVAGELSPEGFMVFRLAVPQIPHSGKAEELLARYGIDAASIRGKVHEILHQIETRPHQVLAGTVD
jgi:transketolase